MIFLFLIVAGNFPFELKSFLNDAGFTLAYTPCNTNVLDGLGFHPDMQAVVIGGRLICAPEVYDYYKTLGKEHKIPVICGRTALSGNYPKDIAYNIKVVGESVFHNFKIEWPSSSVFGRMPEFGDGKGRCVCVCVCVCGAFMIKKLFSHQFSILFKVKSLHMTNSTASTN